MTKEDFIKLLQRLLDTPEDLEFLLYLKNEGLEKLVAIIRGRLED